MAWAVSAGLATFLKRLVLSLQILSFGGNAFDSSPVLQERYGDFLNGSCHVQFLSLESSHISQISISTHDKIIFKLDNLTFAYSESEEKYLIRHVNCRFAVDKCFSTIQVSDSYLRMLSNSSYQHINEGIHQLARFRALFLDMLVLHASAIIYRDEVILFSGVSGAGKSTQARLWLENTDAWVLNYDKPVVKLDGERVLVSGSPWGGKEDLAINEVRPAKALFFVHQAKENRVVRLSAAQAYAQAHLNYFVYPLNEDIENRYNDAVIQLVKKVPVYDLYCTDTSEAVDAVRRALYPEEE